eukprot:Tamp_15783.p2 GENE.Tamp_15783~~Tamp_15783.p2  ORF type:complete len:131 (-),score=18.33 Tamp_15783:673-1065(-)
MFIRTCRLNHSCAPSVRIKWQNGALNSVATRDIASGEELLLSYMRPELDGHGEALSLPQYLQDWYGFVCSCGHCVASMPLAAQGVWAQVFAGAGAAGGGGSEVAGGQRQVAVGRCPGPVLSEDPDDMDFI